MRATLSTPLISDGKTWGGLFYARPYPDTLTDVEIIEESGFTVLGQDERAGATYVWVYGSAASVGTYLSDVDQKLQRLAWFFFIPKGEEVNLVRVKQWDPYRRIAY